MDTLEQYNFLESEINNLIGLERFEPSFNLRLERMKKLMELLGNPEGAYKIVHVGGTAGKGSTSTMISNILRAHGHRVGLHTSPHLQVINERHVIDGAMASTTKLLEVWNIMKPQIVWMGEHYEYGSPTYFEVQVALSLLLFKHVGVAYAVVEVGLGGLLDATNIVNPEIAVLTNVGLDHTQILGDTVEKIAADKAGIIKPSIPVVTGATQPSVLSIFRDRCEDLGVTLVCLGSDFPLVSVDHMQMFGEVQITNASIAYRAAKLLLGNSFDKAAAVQALEQTTVPARIEILQHDPLVILDGAHNPMKISASLETIKKYTAGKKVYTVFALKKDKDVDQVIDLIAPLSTEIICTEFSKENMWTPLAVEFLQSEIIKGYPDIPVSTQRSARDAVKSLTENVSADDVIWIVGSLYLAGDVRDIWFSKGDLLSALE